MLAGAIGPGAPQGIHVVGVGKVLRIIRRRLVREVLTPRGEVVYLDAGLSFRDNLQRAKAARHTRFPLCEEHFDRTIGLVHIKDILAQLDEGEPSLLAIKKELVVVPEMMPLEMLLTRFRDQRSHLAVVLDEFGGNVGIVTLQRVIAEVIGQLSDELGLGRWEFGRLAADEFLVDSAWPFTRCATWCEYRISLSTAHSGSLLMRISFAYLRSVEAFGSLRLDSLAESISHIILSPGWSLLAPVLRIWNTLGRVAFRWRRAFT